MLYQILLGAATYCVGAGALSWWLGGIFKRERAMLGLTVAQLRDAREWSAARQTMLAQPDISVIINAIASPGPESHDSPAYRYTA
jgi:hypothetical protein